MVDRREIKTNLTIISYFFKYLYLKEREQKTIINKMSIKRTIITTIVALALVAVVAPAATQATTVSDLMAQIQALQAQLQGLSGTTSTTTTSGSLPAACVGVTFTRNLLVGSTGSDVKCLQVILNMNASTQVATTGAGAPGYETTTFGPRTLAAVKIWQVAAGFTPANQIGPMSRAKLNAWLGGTSSTTTTTTTTTGGLVAGCTSTVGFSQTTGASCATGTIATSTGPVSAMVSADNPAAGAIIKNQATADLLHINFTGTGTVTSITLQRSGISDQNTLTNVYLFDGNTRITDGYSFNVSGKLVMNGLIIPVNGSHVISVRADVQSYASGVTDSSIAIALTGFNGDAANVQGNTFTIVAGSAASAYLGANSVVSTSLSPTNVNAGTTQYTVWSAPLQINTRAVLLKMANFKMVGSAPTNALTNIRLFIDGVDTGKVATVTSTNGSNYATVDLTSAPITLTTGSHTVDVRADIVAGASRYMQLSVQQASDLTISDPQVGVNIATLGASGVTFTQNLGAYLNIAAGTGSVVTDPTFTSMTNVSAGATNAVIGRFLIHGYGEDVKVNSIQVTPTLSSLPNTTGTLTAVTTAQSVTVGSTTGFVAGNAVTSSGNGAIGTVNSITSPTVMSITFATAPTAALQTITVTDKGLNNVTLYFNGSQIGTTQNPTVTGSALTFNLGSQMIIPAGQDSKLEVRADLQGSTNVAYAGGIITVSLPLQSGNGQGQSSQSSASVPAGLVTANGLTIQSATLAVSKNAGYADQSVSPNNPNTEIGSFVLQNQSTSESVRLTTLTVKLYSDAGTPALTAGQLTGILNLKTSDSTGSGNTPIQPQATNTFSVSDVLAPGASTTITVWADTGAVALLGSNVYTGLTVASIGVTSNISSAGTNVVGQHISLGTGSLASPTLSVASSTPAQFIVSGTSGSANASQTTFNFISTSGSATINELKFVASGTSGSVTNVCVGTVCASPVSGTADLTGLSLVVPNGGGGLPVSVQVSYAPVGTTGLPLSAQITSKISLAYAKYTAGATTVTICATSGFGTCTNPLTGSGTNGQVDGNTMILQGSLPVVTVPTNTSYNLVAGGSNQHVGQVTVGAAAQGGAIKVNQIVFSVGSSGFSTTSIVLTSPILALLGQTTAIAGTSCTPSGTTITCTLGSGYASDFGPISGGASQTFDLFAGVETSQGTASTATVSTSVTASGFKWDDTSYSGLGTTNTTDTGLTGTNIFGFPTGSWTNKD
jgi:DNA-binding protein YbaB